MEILLPDSSVATKLGQGTPNADIARAVSYTHLTRNAFVGHHLPNKNYADD